MTTNGVVEPTEALPIAAPAGPLTVPAAAREPLAPAGAAYVGVLLSLALIAVGVVGVRDGVLAAGWITGSSWTGSAVDSVDGLTFTGWMPFAGVAAVILGVGAVLLAVKPRRKTSLRVTGRSSIVLDQSDVARIASSTAGAVPGVVDARATSTRRKLTLTARTTAGHDDAATRAAISGAVGDTLALLSSTPRIVVRIRPGGGPK